MRALQWVIVAPLLLGSLPGLDWSSSVAVFFVTPLLWLPLLVTIGMGERPRSSAVPFFTACWWIAFAGYICTLSITSLVTDPPSFVYTLLGIIGLCTVAAWVAALLTGVLWRIARRAN